MAVDEKLQKYQSLDDHARQMQHLVRMPEQEEARGRGIDAHAQDPWRGPGFGDAFEKPTEADDRPGETVELAHNKLVARAARMLCPF